MSTGFSIFDFKRTDKTLSNASTFRLVGSKQILYRRETGMTDKLPPQLLALFAPRPPLRYLLPADTAPEKRKTPQISGLAAFLPAVQDAGGDYLPSDTAEQQKEKRRAAKQLRLQKQLRDGIESCTSLPRLTFTLI